MGVRKRSPDGWLLNKITSPSHLSFVATILRSDHSEEVPLGLCAVRFLVEEGVKVKVPRTDKAPVCFLCFLWSLETPVSTAYPDYGGPTSAISNAI